MPKSPDEKAIAINFTPQGVMRSIYKDELLPLYESLGKPKVQRASNVEWEESSDGSGWTVRSAHDPELAIRSILQDCCYKRVVSRIGDLLVFVTREAALEAEVEHFWELLPPP